jgi:hypothetical protein
MRDGMATENCDGGYRRMQRARANIGHEVARGTIANILKEKADPVFVLSIRIVL